MLIILFILTLIVIFSINSKHISIKSIHQIIIYLILLLLLTMKKEKFVNIPENKVIGINGPSTIDTLQKIQDKDIQNLETLYKSVRSIYKTKEDQIKSDQYKKIPVVTSCRNINSSETVPYDTSYSPNNNPIPNVNQDLTRNNLLDIGNRIN